MGKPQGDIQVSHGSVEEQGRALANMKNELEENFKRAKQQVNELESSGAFVGLSGGSFQTKYNEWDQSITRTLQLMSDFGDHLGKTSKAFEEIDKAYSL